MTFRTSPAEYERIAAFDPATSVNPAPDFKCLFVDMGKCEMHLEPHPSHDGHQVWLTAEELDALIEKVDRNREQIALRLAARCGLRTKELLDVAPTDVVDGPAGTMVRVSEGKGGKYRETPIPDALAERIDTTGDTMDDPTEPVLDVTPRTVQNWTEAAAMDCFFETDDIGWKQVSPHDLRRSWAQALLDAGTEPGMVMTWGGWESWPVFREHYLGQYSPRMQQGEREKVNWL